jgi:mono/diheme cytochrome c family protein
MTLGADHEGRALTRVQPVTRTLLALAVIVGSVGVSLTMSAQQDDARRAGEAAFKRVCERCHGAEARGDVGPRLVPFSREYDEVLAIVREGVGQMPPIAARELSDEGVRQIVEYLKSLSQ